MWSCHCKKLLSGFEFCPWVLGSEMRGKEMLRFLPLRNSPDVQRGANQGMSSAFTELDITPRQWKELLYLVTGKSPWDLSWWQGLEGKLESVLSPSAVITTSYGPFAHRSRSVVRADSDGFAPVTCATELLWKPWLQRQGECKFTVLTLGRGSARKLPRHSKGMAAATVFMSHCTALCAPAEEVMRAHRSTRSEQQNKIKLLFVDDMNKIVSLKLLLGLKMCNLS